MKLHTLIKATGSNLSAREGSTIRKFTLITSVTVFIVAALFYFGIVINHKNLGEVKALMEEHIIDKGNSKGEFNVEVEHHWENKLFGYNPYRISVKYMDEQDVDYYYEYDEDANKVNSSGIGAINGKEDKNFKHME
ncbi:hypothetical protein [Paenibacillus sp. YPG26]|uniref:hypothetical protein n=1 Tax=Paenibacillus sp. YPG26 TaxID=2878915 RepID=UPI00203B1485|nr:hypothetical protein [Paenibacillus sp. YPG26]USB33400.1 hypothetical protein LDO05_00710 [Paenibacillus sp. YPG26]